MSPAKSPRNLLELDVQLGTARRGVPHVKRLREWAQAAYLAHVNLHPVHGRRRAVAPAAVSLRVVSPVESRKLNLAWRGKNKPTNVLSFPAGDDELMIEEGACQLGDLAICTQVVAREAKQQGKSAVTPDGAAGISDPLLAITLQLSGAAAIVALAPASVNPIAIKVAL